MADAREVLELMRSVAKSRIHMISTGTTFYDSQKKAFYLDEYGKKLEEIDGLIRRYSLRLVHSIGNERSVPEK